MQSDSSDLADQDTLNYVYDEIGNLIADSSENITNIEWNVYGKVRNVTKSINSKIITTAYLYDAQGNRILKRILEDGIEQKATAHTRDASGNVMQTAITKIDTTEYEYPLYGSSRLGMYRGGTNKLHRMLGNKHYELSNHLGNVLAVVSDARLGEDSINNGQYDYYLPHIVSLSDYYPFGLSMPNRQYESSEYRWGFQGQENDDDLFGDALEFKYRIYNKKIGRFLTIDPLTVKYPHNSPYAFQENKLGLGVELEGKELFDGFSQSYNVIVGNTAFGKSTAGQVFGHILENLAQRDPIHLAEQAIFITPVPIVTNETSNAAYGFTFFGTGDAIATQVSDAAVKIQGGEIEGLVDGAFIVGDAILIYFGLGGKAPKINWNKLVLLPEKHLPLISKLPKITKEAVRLKENISMDFDIKFNGKTTSHTADYINGVIEFDINLPTELLGRGIGKWIVQEAMTEVGGFDAIKGYKASWNASKKYPGGMAKGLREFWKFKEENPNATNNEAAMNTGLGQMLKQKGFEANVQGTPTKSNVTVIFEKVNKGG